MEKFTAVFERDGDWWMAYVEEIPRAHTQGRTMEEARENLREALDLYLESQREISDVKPRGSANPPRPKGGGNPVSRAVMEDRR